MESLFSETYKNSFENVQSRVTKLIPGYKELDYKECLQRLNLPSISYHRPRGDMVDQSFEENLINYGKPIL